MDPPPRYAPRSHPDIDTLSIHSAAPSYISATPSYHTVHPSHPGTPRRNTTSSINTNPGKEPSLADFRIGPTWSTTRANPNARLYHSVAHRRATIASAESERQLLTAAASPRAARLLIQQKIAEVESRLGPFEDAALVGEQAAEEARVERLRRQGRLGDEVLIREDKRWDWLLSQMKDWDERERSWAQFRRGLEGGAKGKLARRLGIKH